MSFKLPIYVKPVLLSDKIAELERELAMRERLYQEWAFGPSPRIKPDEAAKRIAVLKSILIDYRNMAAKIGEQTVLF